MEDAEDSDQSSLTKVKIGDAQAQSIIKPSMPERFPKRGASLQKFRTSFRNRTSDRAENVTTLKQTHAQQQSLRRAMSLRRSVSVAVQTIWSKTLKFSGKPAGIIKPASVSTQITIEEPNEESIERERLITEGSEPNTNRERSRGSLNSGVQWPYPNIKLCHFRRPERLFSYLAREESIQTSVLFQDIIGFNWNH